MTGRAHLMGGALIGVSFMINKNYSEGIPFIIGSMTGSVFLDIDSRNSKISNRLPVLSFMTRLFVGHRGIVHTPIFIIILSIMIQCVSMVLHIPEHFLLGFICGSFCHLLQDSMTRRGIRWLYPITNKSFHILYLRSGRGLFYGFKEVVLTILIAGIIVLPIFLGGYLYG